MIYPIEESMYCITFKWISWTSARCSPQGLYGQTEVIEGSTSLHWCIKLIVLLTISGDGAPSDRIKEKF